MKQRIHSLVQLIALLVVAFPGGQSIHAAQVGPAGYTNAFSSQPPAGDWSTFSVTGGSTTIGTVEQLDAAAQAVAASSISGATIVNGANPADANGLATWSSTGQYLQSRPTGNAAILSMLTLVNNLGGDASSISLSYDLSTAVPFGEQIDGLRAFYSLSGNAGSWLPIPSLTTATPGRLSAILSVNWPGGAPLYILWADDNADGGTDTAFQIDNFFASATPSIQAPADITSDPQNLAVGELQPASFTVGVSGNPPPTIQWYSNNVAILGATNLSYTIDAAPLHFNGLNFRAVVMNEASNVTYMVTSTVAVLTVNADLVAPALIRAFGVPPATVSVDFSEPVRADTANVSGNYAITSLVGNLIVSSAVLSPNGTNVLLTTSEQMVGVTYTLIVNGIRDVSAASNQIPANSTATFMPTSLTTADIGSPSPAGQVQVSGGGFNITAGGTNISGNADQFTFHYQQISGDFDLEVRIDGFAGADLWSKAGLMARETLDANSRQASSFVTPSVAGAFFSQRSTVGGQVVQAGAFPVSYPDSWLRLRRTGNTFTGFAGVDGQNWMQLGTVTLTAPSSIFYVGMAVTGASTNASAAIVRFREYGDGSSGVISLVTLPFEPIGPATRNSGLVISEIMYNAKGSNGLEFVEIFNSEITEEDMSGYRLTGSIGYTFPPGTRLPAGAFLVVGRNPSHLQSVYGISGVLGPWDGASTNGLPANGGRVRLRNRAGAVLIEINYGDRDPWPLAADGAGHSLTLARPSYGTDNPLAWAPSDRIGGSPGRIDGYGPEPLRNVLINEVLAHTDPPLFDYIELYNHGNSPVNLSGAFLSDDRTTNKFQIPTNTILQARGFISFNQTTLGFALSSGGEQIYLVNSNQTRVIDCLDFGPQANGVSFGRYRDGAPGFQELSAPTPDAANAPVLIRNVVINEIMFNPITRDDADEYIELYNRGGAPVDISNWRFTDGIDFRFPAGTVIQPGSFMVVAKNKDHLLSNYAQLNNTNTFGDYSGTLANGGEVVSLAMPDYFTVTNNNIVNTQANYVVVDQVRYRDEGRYSRWADGGGSSLELIEPGSDNSLSANWADSDESLKSAWTNLVHKEFTDNVYPVNADGAMLNEIQIMLLGGGEVLIDDIEVRTEQPSMGANLVANGTFATGLTGWVIQGNHVQSSLEPAGPNNPSASLRIRASSGGDNGANRVETDLTSTLSQNVTNSIRARMRWLGGHRDVLLRLHGGGMETVVTLPVPGNLGTPGQPNSRLIANAGPAIAEVNHSPALPAANQPVVVTARATDTDGIASVQLRYRVDPSASLTTVAMLDNGTGGDAVSGDGLYSATIPGFGGGTLVAFRIEATDARMGGAASSLFPASAPIRECHVRFGDPTYFGSLGAYRLWMTAANINTWTTRDRFSNEALDGTFVYNDYRVIYNAGARYRGSPFIRPGYNTPTGNACAYVWSLPEDDLFLGEDELNLDSLEPSGRDATILRELTAFTIVDQLNLPFSYQRYVHLVVNGVANATRGIPAYSDVQQPNSSYIASWFPDDIDGDIYKIDDWFEFTDGDPRMQGNKSAGLQNFTTVGGAKKQSRYRWSWEKKSNRTLNDDYSTLYTAVDALNAPDATYVRDVEAVFDAEEWMTALAVRHVICDWDGYGYNRGKNNFAYKPDFGGFQLLQWDLDFAIGCQGGHGTGQDLFTVAQGGVNASDHMPEVARLMNHPHFRRIYLRALQRTAEGPMQDANWLPIMDARYRGLQANGVNSANPYTSVQSSPNLTIPAFMTGRRAFVLGASGVGNFLSTPFQVTSALNVTTGTNVLTITGRAPLLSKDIRINGVNWPVTWTSVTGWTAVVVLDAGTNTLQFSGADVEGNPNTASQTVIANYTGSPLSPVGRIVFNEIMYAPTTPDAEFVEIHNRDTGAYDLSNWEINGLDYEFEPGTILSPGQFLVLAKNRQAFIAAYGTNIAIFDTFNGNLQANGETLSLIKPGTNAASDLVIDKVRYENRLPWPPGAAGGGFSLQLMDPDQDNSRAANWSGESGWVKATYTGTIQGGATTFLIFLGVGGGELYIDDLVLVTNTVPEVGPNLITNGDFETPFGSEWTMLGNHSNSVRSTTVSRTGSASLRVIASGIGGPSAAIRQLFPALPANMLCTLTFWYLPSTNGTQVTLRTTPGSLFVNNTLYRPTLSSPGTNNPVLRVLPEFAPVWLNELQAQNTAGIMDNTGEREPWLELYNAGTNAVDLSGYYLANNYDTNLLQWQFPNGTTINPGQFRIVWADGEPGETVGTTHLHTSFRLNSTTGSVALVRIVGGAPQITDYLTYSALGANLSYGDFPDGQPFHRTTMQQTTPGGTNISRLVNVFINEWMAGNASSLIDPSDGSFDDWFELFNAGTEPVDLGNYYLTDNLGNRTQFRVPNNGHYVIPPGGFLLVWADNDSSDNSTDLVDLHASFALSLGGEAIGLYAPDGVTPIDTVTFGQQTNDISRGRFADGSPSFFFMTTPTPRGPNTLGGGNTAPTLAAIADRTNRVGQLISFTAMATDPEVPPQTLNFNLSGAPLGASIGFSSGFFTWIPQAGDAYTTNTMTVTVADTGVPSLNAMRSFTIVVLPQPEASIVDAGGGNVAISFDTIPGRHYRVEYKNNLDDGTWLPLAPDTQATGPTLTIQDNIGAQPHRFYQIVEVN